MTKIENVMGQWIVTIEDAREEVVQSEIYRMEWMFKDRGDNISFIGPRRQENKFIAKGMMELGHEDRSDRRREGRWCNLVRLPADRS
jgi:hypothetical protein